MTKFTKYQDPVKELTVLKEDLAKIIMDAGNSTDLPTKVRLSQEVINKYLESMGTLNTMTKYKDNPNNPEIVKLKEDLRSQLDVATRMNERYSAQNAIDVQKKGKEKAELEDKKGKLKELAEEAVKAVEKRNAPVTHTGGGIPIGVYKRAEKAILKTEKIKQEKAEEEAAFKKLAEEMNAPVTHTGGGIPIGVYKRAEKAILKTEEIKQEKARVAKIDPAMEKLDDILGILLSKTGQIGKGFPAAKEAADTLYTVLYNARTVYEEQLRTSKDGDRKISAAEARAQFKNLCADAIDTAMPVLERDLGWGEYLKNMMRSIANVFIAGAQKLGSSATFFTPDKSEASQAFTQAGEDLQQADEEEDNAPTIS